MTTQERLAKLTNGWRDFKAEVDRTTSQVTSPELNAAREAASRGEPVSPSAFGTLDRITTQFVEVFCMAVPFLADVLLEMEKLTAQLAESEERRVTTRREMDAAHERLHAVVAHRTALFTALQRYERDGNLPSFCPCCGGEMLCDGCDDDCTLNAARAAVMAERKEKTDAVR